MRRIIQFVCILLVVAVFLATPVFAQEQNNRASSYFTSLETYIYRLSETKFEVWFDVTATRMMEKLGVSEIQLQESVNNAQWTTIKTYTPESYSNMLESNTGSCVNCVSYTGSKYYYYRAYVTFYAENSSGWGEMSMYTSPVRLD